MTDQDLKQLLSGIKKVEPSADFMARGRTLIFSLSEQAKAPLFKKGMLRSMAFQLALMMGGVLIVLSAIFFSAVGAQSLARGTIKQSDVIEEAQALDFDIQVGAVAYFKDSSEDVASALRAVSSENN